MCSNKFIVWTGILGLAACLALACGNDRKIESITVRPSSADAQSYPDGKVPFAATGQFNAPPLSVTPQQASWGVASLHSLNGVQILGPVNGEVSIDASGVAQCAAGVSGTFSVAAWVDLPYSGPPPPCPASFYPNMSCPNVHGTAQLTCP